jgi:hypothetical protein
VKPIGRDISLFLSYCTYLYSQPTDQIFTVIWIASQWYIFLAVTVSLFFAPAVPLRAQSTADHQLWTDITLIHHFNAKWRYAGDMGIRGIFTSQEWTQVYARPTFIRLVNGWLDFRGGVSIFQTWNKNSQHQQELRLHQEANIKWPNIAGYIIKHMLRFEERFFFNELSENDISARLRYRPSLETPDFRIFGKQKRLYAKAGIDLFVPLGRASPELFVNNFRLIAGLGYRFSEMYKMQLEYFRQRSRALSEDGFRTAQNVVRLRFYLTMRKADQPD